MPAGETIGTEQFSGVTTLDALRWLLAAALVGLIGAGGLLQARNWTPPAGAAMVAQPAILLELMPLPEPEIATPQPVADPVPAPVEPEIDPTPHLPEDEPPLPSPVAAPALLPQAEPVETPPEPIVEPPAPDEERVEPEPEHAPEPPEEAPLPEPESLNIALPVPVTISAALQTQRQATSPANPQAPRATPRPAPQPTQAETPQAAPQRPQPAAASGPSPAEWQAQVLRHIDRRKIYPREAQRAGQEGAVAIAFTVDAAGRILSVRVTRSSGFPALDQAALETARRASPLPSPPAALGNSIALTASIRFAIR